MKKTFPWLALALGLFLAIILMRFSPLESDEAARLPLLTALLMSEFGFILTAVAAAMGTREMLAEGKTFRMLMITAGNILLALGFLAMGITLWPVGA